MAIQTAIEEQVREFVALNFLFGASASSLGDNTSFLDEGIIDSTGVLELVNFVEDTFGIEVTDEDIVPENFDSVNSLCAYIRRKRR